MQQLGMAFSYDFIKVKSYNGANSSGEGIPFWICWSAVQVDGLKLEVLKGHDVVIVEDIIDTGKTMQVLIPMIERYGANSVAVAISCFLSLVDMCAVRKGHSA